MDHRPCPFCCDESSTIFGRHGDIWLRCRTCRSVFRDITADKFGRLHDEAFQDADFLDAVVATCGLEPARAVWDRLSLPGRSLLEVGPGSGHLLAAAHEAGRAVAAVEHSQANRKFIQDIWGIGPLYPELAAIPQGASFDAVVAINVLEHVYDIAGFLRSIARVIALSAVRKRAGHRHFPRPATRAWGRGNLSGSPGSGSLPDGHNAQPSTMPYAADVAWRGLRLRTASAVAIRNRRRSR